MKNRAFPIARLAAATLACLYFGLDYYFIRDGVAKSEAEIKAVLDRADEIYDPIIDGNLLWKFPFPNEVHWRLVRRGSMIVLNGKIDPGAASEFLEFIDQPELSGETNPAESGWFRLVIDEASTEENVDLSTGSFKMRILPVVPRD